MSCSSINYMVEYEYQFTGPDNVQQGDIAYNKTIISSTTNTETLLF